jgi:hypothetical protein
MNICTLKHKGVITVGKYLRFLENGLGTGDDSHGSSHSADKRVPSGV